MWEALYLIGMEKAQVNVVVEKEENINANQVQIALN